MVHVAMPPRFTIDYGITMFRGAQDAPSALLSVFHDSTGRQRTARLIQGHEHGPALSAGLGNALCEEKFVSPRLLNGRG
jgi:hypothetical protein